jgi:hypothetical protein
MTQLDIESLFGEKYPHASFHDSKIKKISVDFLAREAKFDCIIFIGNPDNRETQPREATGLLTLTGLLYIAVEPPYSNYPYDIDALEISYDGAVESTNFKHPIPKLPESLPDNAYSHCFFITNWNSFMFVAATGANFEWT